MGWVNDHWGVLGGRFDALRPVFTGLENALNPPWAVVTGGAATCTTGTVLAAGTVENTGMMGAVGAGGVISLPKAGLWLCVGLVEFTGSAGTAAAATKIERVVVSTDGTTPVDTVQTVWAGVVPDTATVVVPVTFTVFVTKPGSVQLAVTSTVAGGIGVVSHRLTVCPLDLVPTNRQRFRR